jgi:hypothetical protein
MLKRKSGKYTFHTGDVNIAGWCCLFLHSQHLLHTCGYVVTVNVFIQIGWKNPRAVGWGGFIPMF